jgi:transposase
VKEKLQDGFNTTKALRKLLKLNKQQCYPMALHRIIDKICDNFEEIENMLRSYISLFETKKVILITDLTNTYFEGKIEGYSLAKRGFSKEKRFDCPLVNIAAVINSDGFIIKRKIYKSYVS